MGRGGQAGSCYTTWILTHTQYKLLAIGKRIVPVGPEISMVKGCCSIKAFSLDGSCVISKSAACCCDCEGGGGAPKDTAHRGGGGGGGCVATKGTSQSGGGGGGGGGGD